MQLRPGGLVLAPVLIAASRWRVISYHAWEPPN
jgi:hypothetical protein